MTLFTNYCNKSSKRKIRYTDDSKVDVSHKNIVLKNLASKVISTESLDDEDYDSEASNESTLSEGALNKSRKLSPKFVSEPNLSSLDVNDETPKNSKRHSSRLFRSKVTVSHINKKYQKRTSIIRGTPTSCVSCINDQDTSSEHESEKSCDTPKIERCKEEREFKMHYLTSTPGMSDMLDEECTTPYTINFRRASMSPITKSTQKLSKAMQESIMTPRSRKPLIITSEQRDMPESVESKAESVQSMYRSISPKNDSDFVSSDDDNMSRSSCSRNRSINSTGALPGTEVQVSNKVSSSRRNEDRRFYSDLSSTFSKTEIAKLGHDITIDTRTLSEPFRDYLLSRSVLTATPIDLSILNKSNDNDKISESLLYCLDGNVPSDLTSSINSLAVSENRSPLKNKNVNIEISPSRKRCSSSSDKSGTKKIIVDKENEGIYKLRETEL